MPYFVSFLVMLAFILGLILGFVVGNSEPSDATYEDEWLSEDDDEDESKSGEGGDLRL